MSGTSTSRYDRTFWEYADRLATMYPIVIDRPVGSVHPRFAGVIYPLDYGHLAGARGSDGDHVDLWRGSLPVRTVTGVIVTIDLTKGDGELKLLVGCTPDEMQIALATHNQGDAAGLLVRRPAMSLDEPESEPEIEEGKIS